MQRTRDNLTDRIEYLDIAKGIGIFLVVYAYASAPFSSYICILQPQSVTKCKEKM